MKKLVEEGKVKYLGLLDVNVDIIRCVYKVYFIIVVQVEWFLWFCDIEDEIVFVCR